MRVAIVGAGLAGMAAAIDLVDAGCEVTIFESRPFVGGKVGSWVDAEGNHVEMGLHVFFGCYYQLFDLMEKVGALSNLRLKQHTHTFINRGGKVGELDFRFFTGAPLNGLKAFFTTSQLSLQDKVQNAIALGTSPLVRGLIDFEGAMKTIRNLDSVSFADWFRRHGGSDGSIKRLWNPIAYALGFIDCENISARCMLTIFQFFAAKTEASILRMLEGSPHEYLHKPIINYLEARGTKIYTRRRVREVLFVGENNETRVTGIKVADGETEETITADAYICACDVPGIQRLLPPAWRQWPEFDNIYKLEEIGRASCRERVSTLV